MPTRKQSKQQEQGVARDVGGRVQPASGALWGSKDDVRVPFLTRLEVKITDQGFFRFSLNAYLRVWERAVEAGEVPGFLIEFRPEKRKIVFTEPGVVPGGIRDVWRPQRGIHKVTAAAVKDLDHKAYLGGAHYTLEVQFPRHHVTGISYPTFVETMCQTSLREP